MEWMTNDRDVAVSKAVADPEGVTCGCFSTHKNCHWQVSEEAEFAWKNFVAGIGIVDGALIVVVAAVAAFVGIIVAVVVVAEPGSLERQKGKPKRFLHLQSFERASKPAFVQERLPSVVETW